MEAARHRLTASVSTPTAPPVHVSVRHGGLRWSHETARLSGPGRELHQIDSLRAAETRPRFAFITRGSTTQCNIQPDSLYMSWPHPLLSWLHSISLLAMLSSFFVSLTSSASACDGRKIVLVSCELQEIVPSCLRRCRLRRASLAVSAAEAESSTPHKRGQALL